ncbi:MAG: glycolate oxidase subunit GlcF [Gammaproteobacteria bacterium]|nr:glycolate oxidase subunit GlcF [Gammaproteobacteria bacterium]
MQTSLTKAFKNSALGEEADNILRACVHCGFCTATCPTYQISGDELDSPRGRIYLVKQLLEGNEVSTKTQLHLDRCLTCRACETTCPSGVRYARLLEIGRQLVEEQVPRNITERSLRKLLRMTLPYPKRIKPLIALAQLFKPLLPKRLSVNIPINQDSPPYPLAKHQRNMLVLEGCAQSVMTPATNRAATKVLDRLGITVLSAPDAGCCGALSLHLSAQEESFGFMRRNIDAWWPYIEQGSEAIIITASGCGTTVKEYGHLLKDDSRYAEKAARVSALAKDLSEVIAAQPLDVLNIRGRGRTVAFQSPCSLQHGQQLNGTIEGILAGLGYQLTPVPDDHLCCGSAGTYSILQREWSHKLRENRVNALESGGASIIATANIGCQLHIKAATEVPVVHWIELLAEGLE